MKQLFLRATDATGVSSLVLNSEWRRNRLLILCYHGVSLKDEHCWNPALYVSPGLFRERLQRLRERSCNVLPLGEAIERLYRDDLPPRSVVITFDDGFHDFYAAAWPILRDFGYPATLYLTTYYVDNAHPVFDVAVSYIAWRSTAETMHWHEMLGSGLRPVLVDRGKSVASDVKSCCLKRSLSATEKLRVLEEFAARLQVDLSEICQKRLLHLMSPSEVAEVAHEGCDIQLHTHRHRVSHRRERFLREIDDNRAAIERMTGRSPQHFCYPGGCWLDELPEWMNERNVLSAVTCGIGLAHRRHERYFLPRILDTSVPAPVFDAWVAGIADMISRHASYVDLGQVFADEEGEGSPPPPAPHGA
jgi:peptidoglycan/xylan/chitin deacetylase (PgdA/CDA1 family)